MADIKAWPIICKSALIIMDSQEPLIENQMPLWHKVNEYHIAHYKEKLAVILSNLSIRIIALQ